MKTTLLDSMAWYPNERYENQFTKSKNELNQNELHSFWLLNQSY